MIRNEGEGLFATSRPNAALEQAMNCDDKSSNYWIAVAVMSGHISQYMVLTS